MYATVYHYRRTIKVKNTMHQIKLYLLLAIVCLMTRAYAQRSRNEIETDPKMITSEFASVKNQLWNEMTQDSEKLSKIKKCMNEVKNFLGIYDCMAKSVNMYNYQ